jgi:hypothetical protein
MLLSAVFAIVLLWVGVSLLLHHYWSHKDEPPLSPAKRDGIACLCYFQMSDVSNHETWIVVCFTNALSLGILAPLLSSELT